MGDFHQSGVITTLHDLRAFDRQHLEALLQKAAQRAKIGLVLPVTAADMRALPFANIVEQLAGVNYLGQIVVTLGVAPGEAEYKETQAKIAPLGENARLIWTDGPRISALYDQLTAADLDVSRPGKGRSVWTAFGFLLADPAIKAIALHDCDIVNYDRELLARLCLPMVHPSLDFEFCKAFYARTTDRMYGRVVRLLVNPLVRALISMLGNHPFLDYLSSFRYPLSGEFAVTANLARSNRIPSDWGLEVGTLAEVYRNTSTKRVCQVDLCCRYEHKHQELSAGDPRKGLMKMATDILTTIFRTLASMGVRLEPSHFVTLRSAYVRCAQDAVRQYSADALVNGLIYDRHSEEEAVENFATQITAAGASFMSNPAGGAAIPNWTRVLNAFPDFPERLRAAVDEDAQQFQSGG